MYFTPDGKSAIIVAEAMRRLEFRDPHTMELQGYISTPDCAGINHADFSPDGAYAIFTCEFNNALAKIDLVHHTLADTLPLTPGHMPQDIRVAPDGRTFFVADLLGDGVMVIDGDSFGQVDFIKTGVGAHGLYPSRDGTKLYVTNRGTHNLGGQRNGEGSVSVLDFATRKVVANWTDSRRRQPGHGQPERRRQMAVALGPLRRRHLRLQHRRRVGEVDSRRRHAARADRLAAARAAIPSAIPGTCGKRGFPLGSFTPCRFRLTGLGSSPPNSPRSPRLPDSSWSRSRSISPAFSSSRICRAAQERRWSAPSQRLTATSLMLVPEQPAPLLGAMLTAVGLVAVLAPVLLQSRTWGLRKEATALERLTRAASSEGLNLAFVIGGVLIFAGARSGLYWIAAGDILSIVAIVMSAWVLMIEILR